MSDDTVLRLADYENWPEEAKELYGPDGRKRIQYERGRPVAPVKQRGRPSEYPWDEWMDGELHQVIRGRDYHGQTHSFRNYLAQKASQRNLRFTSNVSVDAEERDIIMFRFTPKS